MYMFLLFADINFNIKYAYTYVYLEVHTLFTQL